MRCGLARLVLVGVLLAGVLAGAGTPAQAGTIPVCELASDLPDGDLDPGPPSLEAPLTISLEATPEPVPDREMILQLLARLQVISVDTQGAGTTASGGGSSWASIPIACPVLVNRIALAVLQGCVSPEQGLSLPDPLSQSLFHPPRV